MAALIGLSMPFISYIHQKTQSVVQGEEIWDVGILPSVRKAGLAGLTTIFQHNGYHSIEGKYLRTHPRHSGWAMLEND